jgi:hypothetical protein
MDDFQVRTRADREVVLRLQILNFTEQEEES